MQQISVVVPCFNEEKALPMFYEAIRRVAAQMHDTYTFEFIFIDDGSTDGTLDVLRNLCGQDERVMYQSFSRNFGKEAGIRCGLETSRGDFVVIMDADMQDPPDLLPKMMERLLAEKADSIATRRVTREGEPPIRSMFARAFYRLFNKFSHVELMDGARDYRIMTRQMVNAILSMPEYNRFSKGIFSWVGFKTIWMEYENVERCAGETKWSFGKLFLYSIEGLTAFSVAPLALASVVGLALCVIAIVFIIYIVIRTWLFGNAVSGYPSLMCVITFVGGIQLFCVGILGQYLAKTYIETKHRPLYIVKENSKQAKN